MKKIPVFKKNGTKIVFLGVIKRDGARRKRNGTHLVSEVLQLPSYGNFGNSEGSQKAYAMKSSLGGWLHDDAKRGARNSRKPSYSWKDQPIRTAWMEERRREQRERERRRANPLLNLLPERESPFDTFSPEEFGQ